MTYFTALIVRAYYDTTSLLQWALDTQLLEQARAKIDDARADATAVGSTLSPNSNLIKDYKALLPPVLPFLIFVVLVGHIIGDASIKYSTNGKQASLSFEWGNLAYANYVYNVLYYYCLSAPREQIRLSSAGTMVTTFCFQTVTHSSFLVLAYLFKPNQGPKTVPVSLIFFLCTPLALATWYMDDGGLQSYTGGHGMAAELQCQGFGIAVAEYMAEELNELYDLDCRVKTITRKGVKMPVIVIPSRSYPALHSLLSPFMAPCMRYKLPTPR